MYHVLESHLLKHLVPLQYAAADWFFPCFGELVVNIIHDVARGLHHPTLQPSLTVGGLHVPSVYVFHLAVEVGVAQVVLLILSKITNFLSKTLKENPLRFLVTYYTLLI